MFILGMGIVCFGPKAINGFRISQILGSDWGMLFSAASHTFSLSLFLGQHRLLEQRRSPAGFRTQEDEHRGFCRGRYRKVKAGDLWGRQPFKNVKICESESPKEVRVVKRQWELWNELPNWQHFVSSCSDFYGVVVAAGSLTVWGCQKKVGWPPGWYTMAT